MGFKKKYQTPVIIKQTLIFVPSQLLIRFPMVQFLFKTAGTFTMKSDASSHGQLLVGVIDDAEFED